MIYVNKFNTASEALSASGLVYPQVVYVEDETSLLIPGSEYDNGDEMVIERDQSGDLIIEKPTPVITYSGLKMTSTGTSTVKVNKMVYQYSNCDVKYSLDGGETWTQYTYGTDEIITLQDGQTICFKGLNSSWSQGGPNYNNFALTGNIKLSGNIMSLVDDGACETLVIPAEKMFDSLFYNQTAITDISELELPATTLTSMCYQSMFYGCSNLVSVPTNLLPATTLTSSCYTSMFYGCSHLTNVPNLPATTLATNCYRQMFRDCVNLVSVPTNLLPATTLVGSDYAYMFFGCTSLTNVPNLPATTLSDSCYMAMFKGCTSLETVPTNLLPATALTTSSYREMFMNCSALTVAPNLPATTTDSSCYESLFQNCALINYVKCMIPAFNGSYGKVSNMLVGVAETGTLVKNPLNTQWREGTSGYPSGWTVQDAA